MTKPSLQSKFNQNIKSNIINFDESDTTKSLTVNVVTNWNDIFVFDK